MPTTFLQPAVLFCTEADVQGLLSIDGEQSRLDDNADGVVDANEAGYIQQAIAWGTSKVLAHCQPLYDTADLATSPLVNEWATIAAAYWACTRRGNPVPESIKQLWLGNGGEDRGALGDLRDVQRQELHVPDIGYRNPDAPAWSNVRVDCRYRLRQARVERPISEQTPTQYATTVDYPAEFTFEI